MHHKEGWEKENSWLIKIDFVCPRVRAGVGATETGYRDVRASRTRATESSVIPSFRWWRLSTLLMVRWFGSRVKRVQTSFCAFSVWSSSESARWLRLAALSPFVSVALLTDIHFFISCLRVQGLENSLCVMRNLSYQLYSELPPSVQLRLEGPSRASANREIETIGCFTLYSKKNVEVRAGGEGAGVIHPCGALCLDPHHLQNLLHIRVATVC